MSPVLLLIARIVLATVFAVAAAGKLFDLAGSRAAMESFGVPVRLAPAAGIMLPIAELCLAVLLVLDATAQTAAWAALALLIAFVAAIARLMARGEAAECHCFGAIHSAPVGWSTLVRNALLAGLALLVALGGSGDQLSGWIASLHGTGALAVAEGAALIAVITGASLFVFSLLRRHGALLLRIDELEARLDGSGPAVTTRPAPRFTVDGLHGDTATLQSLLAPGLPLLLLFTDPGCGPCNALLPDVARWQAEHAGALSIALISTGTREDNLTKAREHGAGNVFIQTARTISESYGVDGTPSGVLVDSGGTISTETATGADQIRSLVARAAGGEGRPLIAVVPPASVPPPPPAPPPASAPPAEVPRALTDVHGRKVDLAPGHGATLLVFWNPQCGFCERLEPALAAWERGRQDADPRLVLVSAGSEESVGALGFRAPVVFDPGAELMTRFGAPGTPSGILIDGKGQVTSAMAVGGPDLMALAAAPAPTPTAPAAPTA